MLTTFTLIDSYKTGELVYGIGTLPFKQEYEILTINVPENLVLPHESMVPLFKILYFIGFNFQYWITLFFAKLFFYFLHVRPYWSIYHNMFNFVLILPLYFFFVKGILNAKPILRFFTIVYVVLHVCVVGLTSIDWDGRFLMPVLPILFILSSSEIYIMIKKFFIVK